jgi:hypothetical protein
VTDRWKLNEISGLPRDHLVLVILSEAKNLGSIFDAFFITEIDQRSFASLNMTAI